MTAASNAVHLFTLKGIQWKIQTFRWGEGRGRGRSSRPWDNGGGGGSPKKFFFGPSDLDPPLAYMYTDQTSKLLVIFFVPPYLYLWLLYKVFQWKNLQTAVWLSFAVLFFVHIRIPWRIVFEDSDDEGVQTILHLEIWFRKSNTFVVWNVTCLIAPALPNGQPLIQRWGRVGGGGENDKYTNNNQIKSKSIILCFL